VSKKRDIPHKTSMLSDLLRSSVEIVRDLKTDMELLVVARPKEIRESETELSFSRLKCVSTTKE
jgi:hypothetical protein